MVKQSNVDIGCRIVGEFIEQNDVPPELKAKLGRGEPVRPTRLTEYIVYAENAPREFTVLLKDGRSVSVRGHGVKHLPPSTAGEEGSYGVYKRTDGDDVFVGLFKAPEVVGIFHGEANVCGQQTNAQFSNAANATTPAASL